jgi:hypothetical protein
MAKTARERQAERRRRKARGARCVEPEINARVVTALIEVGELLAHELFGYPSTEWYSLGEIRQMAEDLMEVGPSAEEREMIEKALVRLPLAAACHV